MLSDNKSDVWSDRLVTRREGVDMRFGLANRTFLAAMLICLTVFASARATTVGLFADSDVPQALFAAREIQTALEGKGHAVTGFGLPGGPRILLCLAL